MFHKPFATILPGVHTNARIVDLLQMLGLETRIVKDDLCLDSSLKSIDYMAVNKILADHITLSKKYLDEVIKKFKETNE